MMAQINRIWNEMESEMKTETLRSKSNDIHNGQIKISISNLNIHQHIQYIVSLSPSK